MSFGEEIDNFISDIKNKDLVNIDDYGNATFEADIQYRFKKQILVSNTDVKIIRNGYEDGKISLSENNELNINFLHLDFTPFHQKYKYNLEKNSLNISGESPKMGGTYSVKLIIHHDE